VTDEPDGDRTQVIGPPAAEPAASRLHQNALPVGTKLGEFEIIDLVGEGGFGIVYLAQDHSLHRKVALKEYMPASLASRGEDCSVSVRSERQRETFDIGLRSFVNEARMLAQFDHPALVKVYRFWEAHGTAYMVMPFFSGQTLQEALKARGEAPPEAWIRSILCRSWRRWRSSTRTRSTTATSRPTTSCCSPATARCCSTSARPGGSSAT
jgi:serine/threonine protein kinase